MESKKAGTYTVLVYATPYTASAGAGTAYTATLTWTVTVTAQDKLATGASTSTMRDGVAAVADGTAEGTDSTSLSSRSITSAQASNIFVTQRNATGTADESMTVVVDGPALITTGTTATGTLQQKEQLLLLRMVTSSMFGQMEQLVQQQLQSRLYLVASQLQRQLSSTEQ